MAYRPRSPITMEHPAQWLAVLRIAVGLYFVKSLVTKMTIVLVGGFLPVPAVSERWIETMPKIVTRQASENPILFYKQYLEGTVLSHPELYAQLTAWGETVVGIGLTLGLLTGLSSLVGLVLVTNYGLATQWMSPGQQGFHLLLFVLMLTFFCARAGRLWGLDGRIASGNPKSLAARRPFS
ncbi:MAG TPA: TQO small subunit DoxD [Gemmatimonadales bacterium]|nr:TQO small subunit DoxD [Gemmatimonadales bacterium]